MSTKLVGKYDFNESGMSLTDLSFYANFESKFPLKSIGETECYSHGKWIRKYGYFPSNWPVRVHVMHGPSQWDQVMPHLLDSHADAFGFFSERLLNDWLLKSRKAGLVLKSPFIVCRELNSISLSDKRSGSLFFHAHSTFWTEKRSDYSRIFEEFEKLPEEFRPISICMHFVDIQKNNHLPYIENGYKVYTAGNWKNEFFIENFYEIVRNFKFAFSNSFGSQAFFCTELGIPFSIINVPPVVVTNSDPNIIVRTTTQKEDPEQLKKVKKAYSGIHTAITAEQLSITKAELGIEKGVSRIQLARYLYRTYFSMRFSGNLFGRLLLFFFKPDLWFRTMLLWNKILNKSAELFSVRSAKRRMDKIQFFRQADFTLISELSDDYAYSKTYGKVHLRRNTSDSYVFKQIFILKEYAALVDIIKSNRIDAKVILDCGANIGLTTMYLFRHFPEAKFHVFEPDEFNYLQLNKNLSANSIPCVFNNLAIWSKPAKIVMKSDFRDGESWSLRAEESVDGTGISAISIDAYCAQNDIQCIDILKIDIEGGEVELFKDAHFSFLQRVKVLCIEIHDEFNIREKIYSILQSNGFVLINSGELTLAINSALCLNR